MGVRSAIYNRQENIMTSSTSKLRVERDGFAIRVYEMGTGNPVTQECLYHGFLSPIDSTLGSDGSFGERHHHGAITHSHAHEGPHYHLSPDRMDTSMFISLPPETDGMEPETYALLRVAAVRHLVNVVETPDPVEVVESKLDAALIAAIGGYTRVGMTRQEAEDRIRDRLVRAADALTHEMRSFMARMEAMAEVEIDVEEIERLGRENPLDPEEKASLTSKIIDAFESQGHPAPALHDMLLANLKASGLPAHFYVVPLESLEVYSGPFDTIEQAQQRVDTSEPTYRIVQGYLVNGRIVTV